MVGLADTPSKHASDQHSHWGNQLQFLRKRWVGSLGALTMFASTAATGTAHAAGLPCNPYDGGTRWHDGVYSQELYEIYGVRGQIEYNGPILCGNATKEGDLGPSLSTAWAMVTDHRDDPSLSYAGWAQAGWFKGGTSENPDGTPKIQPDWPEGTHTFAQFTLKCRSISGSCPGGVTVDTRYFPAGVSKYNYYVADSADNGAMHLYIDDASVFNTGEADFPYSPVNVWDSYWRTEFAGETADSTSEVSGQYPGGIGDKTAFGTLQYNRLR